MLLVLTLLTVLSSGCGRSEAKYTADGKKQIITIGYLPITHALAVFEEKELLDADENSTLQIQLQKFSSWTDLMDALNSGRINGASVLNLRWQPSVTDWISKQWHWDIKMEMW